MKILIVNADDYGRTPGVSAGIREAHLNGIVTSTTVMMNLPDAVEELARAGQVCPGLGFGVHLNLTVGRPITPSSLIPSLVDADGQFHSRDALMRRAGLIDPSHVEIELRAQIDSFLEVGLPLDHLDSHHHITTLNPSLWDIHLHLATEYNCGTRPPFPTDVSPEDLAHTYPESAISFASGVAVETLRSSGIRSPDYFFASFFGPGSTLTHLMTLLEKMPSGVTELMCHPGYLDPDLRATSGYTYEREEELRILTHPSARETLNRGEIHLTTYQDAWGNSRTA